MKVYGVILVILYALLAGCSDAEIYADPALQAQDARATIQVATAIAQGTAEAGRQIERESTREAARTRQASQDEIAAIEAEIRGTAEALSVIETVNAATAAADSLKLTSTAQVIGTATAWPMTMTPLAATSQVMSYQLQTAQAKANFESLGILIREAGFMVILVAVVIALVRALSRRLDITVTPMGIVTLDSGADGRLSHRLLLPDILDLPAEDVPVAPRASGKSQAPTYDNRSLALKLVIDSIRVAGQNSRELPGHRRLGWSSGTWQVVKGFLEDAKAVYSIPDQGTYLTDGDLGNLHFDLKTGKLKV